MPTMWTLTEDEFGQKYLLAGAINSAEWLENGGVLSYFLFGHAADKSPGAVNWLKLDRKVHAHSLIADMGVDDGESLWYRVETN